MTTHPSTPHPAPGSPTSPRSWPRAVVVVVVVAAAAAAAVLLTVPATTGVSWGARLAESNGDTATERYDTASQVPATDRPSWLPAARELTDVIVKRPGPAALDDGADPGAVKVDAVVPTGWAVPAQCSPTGYDQPFDGGGTWPLTTTSTLVSCPDPTGAWTVLLDDGHLYAWR